MNKLATEDRVRVVSALVEGNSIRATCRMTGVAKGTVLKLLVDLGRSCVAFHNEKVRNLSCEVIQCDEVWSFCYAKEKNIPPAKRRMPGYGDVWTWTALDSDSKLIVSWRVGDRDAGTGTRFMRDVAARLANRVQLTTDGHRAYLRAVEAAFGGEVDFAQLNKIYRQDRDGEARYSPPVCVGCETKVVEGDPDPAEISTSHVERSNLTLRMGSRRFTRLTNAFSKKLANLEAAVALHMTHYNFCRRHQTLRVTPAMAAGVSQTLWSIADLVGLLDRVPAN